jgi:hypothetical protein
MTGPEHYAEAERLAAQAETWAGADHGLAASMSLGERLSRRVGDLAAAQVHAMLAVAAAQADANGLATAMDSELPGIWQRLGALEAAADWRVHR